MVIVPTIKKDLCAGNRFLFAHKIESAACDFILFSFVVSTRNIFTRLCFVFPQKANWKSLFKVNLLMCMSSSNTVRLDLNPNPKTQALLRIMDHTPKRKIQINFSCLSKKSFKSFVLNVSTAFQFYQKSIFFSLFKNTCWVMAYLHRLDNVVCQFWKYLKKKRYFFFN